MVGYEYYLFFLQAPCFVFVDEIDAIAGRHTKKDPRGRATFEALISQLDGEYVITMCWHLFRVLQTIYFVIIIAVRLYKTNYVL